jgi:uncharacterized NAD-dependent epimerase/dehydratase family protein
VIDFYEAAANIMHPCRVIALAVNGHQFSDEEVAEHCAQMENELGLPTCDVIRHGPDKLVTAVQELQRELRDVEATENTHETGTAEG